MRRVHEVERSEEYTKEEKKKRTNEYKVQSIYRIHLEIKVMERERESNRDSNSDRINWRMLDVCVFIHEHLHTGAFVFDFLSFSHWTHIEWVHLGLTCVSLTLDSIDVFSLSSPLSRSLTLSVCRFVFVCCVVCVVFDTKWAFGYDNESWHLIRRSTLFVYFFFHSYCRSQSAETLGIRS